jgi:hypothetical protein
VLDADKPGAQLYHGAGGLDWYFLSLNNDDIFGLLVDAAGSGLNDEHLSS